MTKQYDTAITLSYWINQDGSLTEQARLRTDQSIAFCGLGVTRTLTMTGGVNSTGLDPTKDALINHATAMKYHALEQGISEEKIYMEEKSLETVGQAIFTKTGVVVPNNLERIMVVSSDYHMERMRELFSFIYGNEFDLTYVGVRTPDGESRSMETEQGSLQAFRSTFEGVTPGNDDQIMDALLTRHGLYKNFQL